MSFKPTSSYPELVFGVSTLAEDNMDYAFGDSQKVLANRNNFLAQHGLELTNCVPLGQEHGDTILLADGGNKGVGAFSPADLPPADAVITKTKGVVLMLLTADCMPLALYDPAQTVVALAHLGWRGTGHELARKVVERMREQFITKPKDLIVWSGPFIQKDSYVVAELQQKDDPRWQSFIEARNGGGWAVDLAGYVTRQLENAGVKSGNIHLSSVDTYTSPDHFSHYRSGQTGESEGRFATILGLK